MSPRKQQQLLSTVALDPDGLMDATLIRQFFAGKGKTTFHRWRTDLDPERRFPEPDLYIGSAPYWKRETVVRWRDEQAKHRDIRRQAVRDRAQRAGSQNAQIHSRAPGTSAESQLHAQAASPQIAADTPGQPSARFGG
jgi:hypothetical protein